MLPVIYSMSVSLDGFNARPTGDIGWTAPDAEQFRFHAEQTMSGEAEVEFARIWRPIPKVVFSPDAEFGGRHCAAGDRRHRHRGRPAP